MHRPVPALAIGLVTYNVHFGIRGTVALEAIAGGAPGAGGIGVMSRLQAAGEPVIGVFALRSAAGRQ